MSGQNKNLRVRQKHHSSGGFQYERLNVFLTTEYLMFACRPFCFCIPLFSRVQMSLVHEDFTVELGPVLPWKAVSEQQWRVVLCFRLHHSSQVEIIMIFAICSFVSCNCFTIKASLCFISWTRLMRSSSWNVWLCFDAYKNSSDSTFGVLESHVGMADPATSDGNHNIKEKFFKTENSVYLSTVMPVQSQVMHRRSQNVSGTSQHSCCSDHNRAWARWPLVHTSWCRSTVAVNKNWILGEVF